MQASPEPSQVLLPICAPSVEQGQEEGHEFDVTGFI